VAKKLVLQIGEQALGACGTAANPAGIRFEPPVKAVPDACRNRPTLQAAGGFYIEKSGPFSCDRSNIDTFASKGPGFLSPQKIHYPGKTGMTHKTFMKLIPALMLLAFGGAAGAAGFAIQNQTGSGTGNAFAGAAATAEDAGTVHFNPAGMTNLPQGHNIALSGTLL